MVWDFIQLKDCSRRLSEDDSSLSCMLHNGIRTLPFWHMGESFGNVGVAVEFIDSLPYGVFNRSFILIERR